jgi:hypothetical protein
MCPETNDFCSFAMTHFYWHFLTQAFTPRLAFVPSTLSAGSATSLDACRVNAKKEKLKRNRENMRKFKTGGGRRGLSRRKILKKAQSSKARQEEAEFITKCFITVPVSSAEDSK